MRKTLPELKRLNIRVTPEMHAWLSNNANKRGITLNAMVIFALETYMNQQTVTSYLPEMMEELDRRKSKGDLEEMIQLKKEYDDFQAKLKLMDAAVHSSEGGSLDME